MQKLMFSLLAVASLVSARFAFGGEGVIQSKPIVIAHRGASGYLPEHTLEAKTAAHIMGADYLEQDIILSKDGIPLVLHDVQIDTVTDVVQKFPERKRENGRYYALDFSLAELKSLRVSERFNPKTGQAVYTNRFPLWKSTFQISTLEEEIQFIQGLNKSTGREAGIYPEIKDPQWHRKQGYDISKISLAILERYGYRTKSDKFYLQCFDYPELKRARTELGFKGKMILLQGANTAEDEFHRTRAGLEEIASIVDGIGPALNNVVIPRTNGTYQITDLVSNAHALHLEVHPYTMRADDLPNYAKTLEDLCRIFFVEAQVDGAFSDFPDRAVKFITATSKFSK